MGDLNRSLVVQALRDHGPLSRADLAKMAGVTRMTISNIVNTLLAAGLLEERDPVPAAGVGKPARPLWFAPGAGLSVAVTIAAGAYETALVDARGEIVTAASGTFDAGAPSDSNLRSRLLRTVGRLMPSRPDAVLGIGVAVPGTTNPRTSEVLGSGQIPGLIGTSLADGLRRRFGLPVHLDNDARVQALGEKWFGAGRGVANFASVQTGHGLGVGLVLEGVLCRGMTGEAGELGHSCVVAQGGQRCRCGLRGCWETIATLQWLRKEAAAHRLTGAAHLDSDRLSALVSAGVPGARELQIAYADNLAVGLANLVQIFDPELLVLHGDVTRGGKEFLGLIRDRVGLRALPDLDESRIVFSELSTQAGLLGAAALVLSDTFSLLP
jgi:predicted NBD/HSP70 family sugar kinase